MMTEADSNQPAPSQTGFDRGCPSHPFAMQFATHKNTSPVSALLRAMAISGDERERASNLQRGLSDENRQNFSLKVGAMLKHLDEWMSLPNENQKSNILGRSVLVTSLGLAKMKEEIQEVTSLDGSSVKDFLGGMGRDNLHGREVEDLNAFDIYSTSAQSSRAADKNSGSSVLSSSSVTDTITVMETQLVLRCYVHERVVRDLKARCLPISFIREIVRNKIIGGAFIREKQQYQKLVTRDVFELRIDEKIRVLYARSKNAVLIIEIVWNHKLEKPIKRAQQEMSMMQNWMAGCGYIDEEPFVMIDCLSGRLRPLYVIDFRYHSESGVGGGVDNDGGDGDGDQSSDVFVPSMLDLVLSPQQRNACENAMAVKNEVYYTDSGEGAEQESPSTTSITTSLHLLRPVLNIVVCQGSAGNGKTTCLLRSGLSKAQSKEKVVFVAATQIFSESVQQDLGGNITSDFRIIVRDRFTDMIRSVYAERHTLQALDATEVSPSEVLEWVMEMEPKSGKKMGKGAAKALSEWLMKGHREAADTVTYKEYVIAYCVWKRDEKKRDEGDMWRFALERLLEESRSDFSAERLVGATPSEREGCDQYDRDCDMLVIDEAQLYPAETYFQALLLWYRPKKTLLLGMDTKQAVYLGCSNRRALLKAVLDCGWQRRTLIVHSLTTNFRLPARLVALSNAMVSALKAFYPKVFDEYNKDNGFDNRSSTTPSSSFPPSTFISSSSASEVSSRMDTLAAAEASDAPVRAIERFPAMLVVGAAAVKLRKEICDRMDVSRRSVLSMRFAHIDLESAPASYSTSPHSTITSTSTSTSTIGSALSDLPTINFQAVSGLEISLPVIVDSLLTTYIEELCPRKIFSSVNAQRDVGDHEMNMLRTALCTVYTVLTRCRGPLIWLEDRMRPDLKKAHPLIRTLKEELQKGSMDIDYITDPNKIDKKFVDHIFNLTDVEEITAAYEDSTRQILMKFKNSYWSAVNALASLSKDTGPDRNRPVAFGVSAEYSALIADKRVLIAQLSMTAHEGTQRCCCVIDRLCDTLLLKAGSGDGSWSHEWGHDLRSLLEVVEKFPHTARITLQQSTRGLLPTPSLSPALPLTLSLPDSSRGQGVQSIETELSRVVKSMCTCERETDSADLTFVLAFKGAAINFNLDSEEKKPPGVPVWVVHRVRKRKGVKDGSVLKVKGRVSTAAVTEGVAPAQECIAEDSFILSCVGSPDKYIISEEETGDIHPSISVALYKFEHSSELCITRASSGCLTMQERTLVPGSTYLTQSTSLSTKKIRCSMDGATLAGSARAHCCGPFVVEIDGTLMGSSAVYVPEGTVMDTANDNENESDTRTETAIVTGKRKREAIDSDVLRWPPIGDERMISLLAALFSGKNLDLYSRNSSHDRIGMDTSSFTDTQGTDSNTTSESEFGCVSGSNPLSGLGVLSDRHRTAAAFVYNNFMGGSLLFSDYSVDVLPWSVILPTVSLYRGVGEAVGEGDGDRVIAMALLDHARRCVEACVISHHATGRTAPHQLHFQHGERPTLPLFVSRRGILDASQLELQLD